MERCSGTMTESQMEYNELMGNLLSERNYFKEIIFRLTRDISERLYDMDSFLIGYVDMEYSVEPLKDIINRASCLDPEDDELVREVSLFGKYVEDLSAGKKISPDVYGVADGYVRELCSSADELKSLWDECLRLGFHIGVEE